MSIPASSRLSSVPPETMRRSISSSFAGAARAMPPAAGGACARGAGYDVEVGPHAGEPRVGVLELGEFDLSLACGCGTREDVEDEFAAVRTWRDDLLEFADLTRRRSLSKMTTSA